MADSYALTFGGYTIDIGSYVLKDPGPDFDFGAVYQPAYAHNPYTEGGRLSFEQSQVRKFSFPLRLASSAVFNGLEGLEQTLRNLARAGATIDLGPEGTPAANVTRFDVLDGRINSRYSLDLQRISRREATLELDVQPFGYLPTWILLASVASIGLPGFMAIPGGSIIGDAPGIIDLLIQPSVGTFYPAIRTIAAAGSYNVPSAGGWIPDMIAWSMGAKASFQAYWPVSSTVTKISFPGYFMADSFLPGGVPTAIGLNLGNASVSPMPSTFENWLLAVIPTALEPSYRGRFRLYAWAKQRSSFVGGIQIAADVVNIATVGASGFVGYFEDRSGGDTAPLASTTALVATVPPGITIGSTGNMWTAGASPAYHLLDCGEVSLPATGSGMTQLAGIRFWQNLPSNMPSVANGALAFGGFYLLPLDGGAGIMPRGLAHPSLMVQAQMPRAALRRLRINKPNVILETLDDLANHAPVGNGLQYYRGDFPFIGASTIQLDLVGGARPLTARASQAASAPPELPPVNSAPLYAAAALFYRPRFVFVRSI